VASQWYCFTDDEEGPFTFEELARKIAGEELLPADLVRRSESSQWQRVDTVFGLMRAAQQTRSKIALSRRSPSHSPLGQSLVQLCRSVFPYLPPEKTLMGASLGCVLLCLLEVTWLWYRQPERFPVPPPGGIVVLAPDRLEQLRPPAPLTPTVPGLPPGHPELVPGFEEVDWMKSPTLSADLLTIVYIGYAGDEHLDDLVMAERARVDAPFQNHRPLRGINSSLREAHPTLSPDGKQLVFTRLETPSTLWITRRDRTDVPFSAPKKLVLQNGPPAELHHDAPQFLDARNLYFTASDQKFTQRMQWTALQQGGDILRVLAPISVNNPWPRFFFTARGKRAFLPTPNGICITAWSRRTGQFEDPELLIGVDVTGPDLTVNDDTLWVTPKEDIVFYCGPGPQPAPASRRQLWMLRF